MPFSDPPCPVCPNPSFRSRTRPRFAVGLSLNVAPRSSARQPVRLGTLYREAWRIVHRSRL
jgi:hypothetical protein